MTATDGGRESAERMGVNRARGCLDPAETGQRTICAVGDRVIYGADLIDAGTGGCRPAQSVATDDKKFSRIINRDRGNGD